MAINAAEMLSGFNALVGAASDGLIAKRNWLTLSRAIADGELARGSLFAFLRMIEQYDEKASCCRASYADLAGWMGLGDRTKATEPLKKLLDRRYISVIRKGEGTRRSEYAIIWVYPDDEATLDDQRDNAIEAASRPWSISK